MVYLEVSQEAFPESGKVSTTHHNFSVPEHILISSWVKDNATRVGVDPMNVQDAQLPLLLSPLEDLHNTNTAQPGGQG